MCAENWYNSIATAVTLLSPAWQDLDPAIEHAVLAFPENPMPYTMTVARQPCTWLSRVIVGATPLVSIVACGLPTEAPKAPLIDVRWVVPTQSSRITVGSLLPNGVTILPDSSGFTVAIPNSTITRTLSQDCSACVAANGLTAPKPAFVAFASLASSLPAEITSSALVGGALQVVMSHSYTFDPLRPNAASSGARGYAVITVSNGTTVIGKDSIDGATTAFSPNTPLTRSIPLTGPISGSAPVTASVVVNSPLGDPVPIDASRTLTATSSAVGLKVASANVTVVGRQLNSTSSIDLSGIDKTVTDKVQGGALLLTLVNPFAVTSLLTVKFSPQGGATITRTVPLATGNSTVRIDFNTAELKSLLGHNVSLAYTGAVTPTAGFVTISPRQAVVITTRLDIALQVGG